MFMFLCSLFASCQATWGLIQDIKASSSQLPGLHTAFMGLPGGSVVKNPPATVGDTGDVGSIPGSGRSPGGGHGYPLQYSGLENPHGQRSLSGYSPWGHKEQDTTEQLTLSTIRVFLYRLTYSQNHNLLFYVLHLCCVFLQNMNSINFRQVPSGQREYLTSPCNNS